MGDFEPLLEQDIEIDAPAARVWELVSDVTRMAEWSPQVTSTRLRQGFDEVGLGAQFTNRNEHGELQWTTHAEVVRFDAPRALAFRIQENRVVWSFALESTEAGATHVVQRRETPEGISSLSLEWTDAYLGGQEAFTASQLAGMRQTLEAIKAAAEA